ncbi:MAG: hypothetical protein IKU53_04750 [Firmicutes bacterium]|nr:hypothetical protein [Bacillota bacterium]
MNTNKEKRDAWEAYNNSFKKSSTSDVIKESTEHRDEWLECKFDEHGKEDDGSWE